MYYSTSQVDLSLGGTLRVAGREKLLMSVDPGAQDLDGCESDKRTEGLALHDLGYVRMVAMGDARTTADDRPLACSQLGHDLPSRLPDRRNFFSLVLARLQRRRQVTDTLSPV